MWALISAEVVAGNSRAFVTDRRCVISADHKCLMVICCALSTVDIKASHFVAYLHLKKSLLSTMPECNLHSRFIWVIVSSLLREDL